MGKTINGIFEPFHDYVNKQLNVRKTIITPITSTTLPDVEEMLASPIIFNKTLFL